MFLGALRVSLDDIEVGTLEYFENERQRFTFAPGYRAAFLTNRPILGQIFEDRFPEPIEVDGPICWFAHLLPQGVMRRWRSRLLSLDEDDAFRLLECLGEDLPGAVTLTPTRGLVRPRTPVVQERQEPVEPEETLRFSLAGAQWKLSARSEGTGLTTTARNGEKSFVAKFHAPEYPELPQCEFATMTWAAESGIVTPPFSLRSVDDFDVVPSQMPKGDGKVFVIERFDRRATGKVHIEDFGQILDLPPGNEQYNSTYEEIAAVLKWISSRESVAEFVRQLIFSICCGNGDAHVKNFSVMYGDGRNCTIAPAYDIVSTIQYPWIADELALPLGETRDFGSIAISSFEKLFANAGFDNAKGVAIVKETLDRISAGWNCSGVRENFSQKQQERIERHFQRLPLINGK
ncbi:type II toxin-antitoxin system HipA family toxin [Planctomycetota bacterium]